MDKRLVAKLGAGAAAAVLTFVAAREGLVLRVSPDPIGRLAVCYGHDDPTLTRGKSYTREECNALLEGDLLKHADALDCFKVPLTDGQKVAIVSFAFNVGTGAACNSTMARKANAGAAPAVWCAELSRWVLAGGKPLPGLIKRRAAERELCERPA